MSKASRRRKRAALKKTHWVENTVIANVSCQGGKHRIEWRTNGRIVLLDHDHDHPARDQAWKAMGGKVRCPDIMHLIQKRESDGRIKKLSVFAAAAKAATMERMTARAVHPSVLMLSLTKRAAYWQRENRAVRIVRRRVRRLAEQRDFHFPKELAIVSPAHRTGLEVSKGGRGTLYLRSALHWISTVWARGLSVVDGRLIVDVKSFSGRTAVVRYLRPPDSHLDKWALVSSGLRKLHRTDGKWEPVWVNKKRNDQRQMRMKL